jgi:GrpB-like predicted nucleotidyltransferase (UPF0157 family)/predicted kinase
MIVIINGALGVGKTEVTWKLIEYFDQAVMLDGDYLGAVHPFEIYDEARIEYLYQTIRHVVAWHVEHAYHNFVIDYVFETPESLARLRHLLSDLDDVIYAFRLTCAEDEMARRVLNRNPSSADAAWELNRFRELAAIQNENALRGDLGYVTDTTALTIDQAADAIWRIIREEVEIVPYHPEWPAQFEAEKRRIEQALGDLAVEIHHIGSTAIPGLDAKPIIDIMIVVRKLDDAAQCIVPLKELGYTFIDYPQNVDRRFFRKGLHPRTHHAHIVEQGSQTLKVHLAFRDALRNDPRLRDQYAALKYELAERYRNDRAQYTESKTEFVERVVESAHV